MAAGVRAVRIYPFSRLARLAGLFYFLQTRQHRTYIQRDLSSRACLRMIVAGRPLGQNGGPAS